MQGITFLQIKRFDLLPQGRTMTPSTLPSSFTRCHEKQFGNVWRQGAGQEGEQKGGRSEGIGTQEDPHG